MALDAVAASGLVKPSGQDILVGPTETTGDSASPSSFRGVLNQLLDGATRSHSSADAAVRDMAMGQTDNLHAVMLQMAQADLTFHLILEIRNRLTDAYQEVMKMAM
jgi:flagellar hook-basal body complex protein FliE